MSRATVHPGYIVYRVLAKVPHLEKLSTKGNQLIQLPVVMGMCSLCDMLTSVDFAYAPPRTAP